MHLHRLPRHHDLVDQQCHQLLPSLRIQRIKPIPHLLRERIELSGAGRLDAGDFLQNLLPPPRKPISVVIPTEFERWNSILSGVGGVATMYLLQQQIRLQHPVHRAGLGVSRLQVPICLGQVSSYHAQIRMAEEPLERDQVDPVAQGNQCKRPPEVMRGGC